GAASRKGERTGWDVRQGPPGRRRGGGPSLPVRLVRRARRCGRSPRRSGFPGRECTSFSPTSPLRSSREESRLDWGTVGRGGGETNLSRSARSAGSIEGTQMKKLLIATLTAAVLSLGVLAGLAVADS